MKYPNDEKENSRIDTGSLYYIFAIVLAICLGGLLYLTLGVNNADASVEQTDGTTTMSSWSWPVYQWLGTGLSGDADELRFYYNSSDPVDPQVYLMEIHPDLVDYSASTYDPTVDNFIFSSWNDIGVDINGSSWGDKLGGTDTGTCGETYCAYAYANTVSVNTTENYIYIDPTSLTSNNNGAFTEFDPTKHYILQIVWPYGTRTSFRGVGSTSDNFTYGQAGVENGFSTSVLNGIQDFKFYLTGAVTQSTAPTYSNEVTITSPNSNYTSANGRIEFSLDYGVAPLEGYETFLNNLYRHRVEVWADSSTSTEWNVKGLVASQDLGFLPFTGATSTISFWSDNLVEAETQTWTNFKAYLYSDYLGLVATSTVVTNTIDIIGYADGNDIYNDSVQQFDDFLRSIESNFDTTSTSSMWYVDCSDYGWASSTAPMVEYVNVFNYDLIPYPSENFIPGSICYAKKTLWDIGASLFKPSDTSLDFLSGAWQEFKYVFPFNIYSSFLQLGEELVDNASETYTEYQSTASSTLVLEFPFNGGTTNITILTPTFLADTIGESEAETVFDGMRVLLRLLFGLVVFTMLRRMI